MWVVRRLSLLRVDVYSALRVAWGVWQASEFRFFLGGNVFFRGSPVVAFFG